MLAIRSSAVQNLSKDAALGAERLSRYFAGPGFFRPVRMIIIIKGAGRKMRPAVCRGNLFLIRLSGSHLKSIYFLDDAALQCPIYRHSL